jgi:hypothetical protein
VVVEEHSLLDEDVEEELVLDEDVDEESVLDEDVEEELVLEEEVEDELALEEVSLSIGSHVFVSGSQSSVSPLTPVSSFGSSSQVGIEQAS